MGESFEGARAPVDITGDSLAGCAKMHDALAMSTQAMNRDLEVTIVLLYASWVQNTGGEVSSGNMICVRVLGRVHVFYGF